MSYYMGDYYQGDYYRGDPGFFSFLGKAVRGIGRLAGIGGGGTKIIQAAAPQVLAPAGRAIIRRIPGIVRRGAGAIARHPVLTAAGGAAAVGALAGRAAAPGMEGVPRGFHVSKRTGAVVKNRRMRVTNPRALRRAIRRATGFARLARRVLRFTSPRPPRGRPYFKRKGRAAGKRM